MERVSELLKKIDTLCEFKLDSDNIEKILELYNVVYEDTIKYGLDLSPIMKYANFLYEDLGLIDDAFNIIQELSKLYESPERNTSSREMAEFLFLKGKIYVGVRRYNDAIVLLDDGIEIADELYRNEGASVAALCGELRNITANALLFAQGKKQARKYYERAKKYYEIACEYDSKSNKHLLAKLYVNYGGSFEYDENLDDKAIDFSNKGIELFNEVENLSEKNKSCIASAYYNLAIVYRRLKDYDKTEQCLLESIRIREEIRKKKPAMVELYLSQSYYLLGQVYASNKNDIEKALDALNECKKLRISLRKRSMVYAPDLARIFNYIIDRFYFIKDFEFTKAYSAEYVELLLELKELSENERRNLCEEGYLLMYDMFEERKYERSLEIFTRVADVYLENGSSRWLLEMANDEVDLLHKLCKILDKPETYYEYANKIAGRYKEGIVEVKEF